MSGGVPHGTSATRAEPLDDVLTGGRDAPDWPPTTGRRTVAVAVAGAVLLTGAVLAQRAASDGPAAPAPPELVLREGSALIPRQRPGPPGLLHTGLQLEVVNAGALPVLLVGAELVPGAWVVDVVDDADTRVRSGRGRHLRPGWNATLVVHRLVDCAAGAGRDPAPQALVLRLEVDGRRVQERIDVGAEQRAYDGRLDDALGRPEAACAGAPDPGPWTPPVLPLRLPDVP